MKFNYKHKKEETSLNKFYCGAERVGEHLEASDRGDCYREEVSQHH